MPCHHHTLRLGSAILPCLASRDRVLAVWPYPVIDDMDRIGGAVLRCAFFAGLASAFVALGLGAVWLLQMRA